MSEPSDLYKKGFEMRKKLRSEAESDVLSFLINWVEVDTMSGAGEWMTQSYAVDAGTHVFAWRYIKNPSLTSEEDAGFLDLVQAIGGVVP